MLVLIIGLVVFLGIHSVSIVAPHWRSATIARLGEKPWKGLYSLAAGVGLALVIVGYGLARQHPIVVYSPPVGLRHFVLLLMVPTVVLVELRLRRLRTTVELLTLLPLVLPPIALVVGVRSVLAWAPDYFLNTPLAQAFFALQKPSLPWILVLVYVILALPFVYRALDAGVRGADLRTLTEAARSLGASWPRVLVSVVLPVLRTSVLNASFLTFALVLGEFTIASILGFETFPVWILKISGDDPQLSVSVSVLSLGVTWGLLLLISALDRRRGTKETS